MILIITLFDYKNIYVFVWIKKKGKKLERKEKRVRIFLLRGKKVKVNEKFKIHVIDLILIFGIYFKN